MMRVLKSCQICIHNSRVHKIAIGLCEWINKLRFIAIGLLVVVI